jgi:enoyl-[acyl-carrier protein] reductase II
MIPQEHRDFVDRILEEHDVPPMPEGVEGQMKAAGLGVEAEGPDQVALALRHPVSMLVNALGPPPAYAIEAAHAQGVLVGALCGSPRHAQRNLERGVDVMIARGTEAGGHTGLVATLPLVPQIVDAVGDRVPVVAAGGIFDGRGLAAALSLGADGIWVGTRFIATPEARSVKGYKDALIASAEDGTTISRAYSGKPMRVVANGYTEYFDSHPEELQPFPNQMARSFSDNALHLASDPDVADIDVDKECYPAGQGAGAIGQLTPAADIVAELVTDAEAALARVDALR